MRTEQYEAGGRSLPIDVFEPEDDGGGGRPAVVFLHGGAWRFGDRSQFHPQCERFARAGYVAATANYVLDGSILDAAHSARAAVEHVLANADGWGVDPCRVAVGGGSAGGHLAACLLVCPEVRPSVPLAGSVLFNPVFDLAAIVTALGELAPEVGVPAERLSPLHQDVGDLAPTIVFHGTHDSLVPIAHSRDFRDRATAAGARCDLVEFEGREHAFFNPVPPELAGAINEGDFDATVDAALTFLGEVPTAELPST